MTKKKFNPTEWLNNPPVVETLRATSETSSPHDGIETITRRIESAAIDIAPSYSDWRDVGFALADALGENGRTYYHRLSRFYPGYTESETDRQYTACLNAHGHGVTIKTLFHLAKQAGINIAVTPPTKSSESSISSKSSTADIEDIEEVEEIESVMPMPTFSQDIQTSLPSLLSKIICKSISPEDADLLILGSLTVFSACLPNVFGNYGNREVFPNLFLFVAAQASAGKGRLTLCRHLVQPIHSKLKEMYSAEMEEYKRKQAEYMANKKDPDAEPPAEPPLKTLLIPANSSATSVYQVLNDNKGVGLIFETEGDTLANTFKSDYGNFSDGFRKAFHHEMISYTRRKDREFVELGKPRLSALLSGTPQQILSLIPDAENGLFSRFLFYYMNIRLEWNNVFADNEETVDIYFRQLGYQFFDLYKILQSAEPIRFTFSLTQQDDFNTFFEQLQKEYSEKFGLEIVASVRRLGLITFRIAMILSSLRIIDSGQITQLLICKDCDFQISLTMAKVLMQHTSKVFGILPGSESTSKPTGTTLVKQTFLDNLPIEFDRKTYLDIAAKLKIPSKTAEKYISKFCEKGLLKHLAHGHYGKVT